MSPRLSKTVLLKPRPVWTLTYLLLYSWAEVWWGRGDRLEVEPGRNQEPGAWPLRTMEGPSGFSQSD